MIAFLRGKLVYKSPSQVYLDVNGVGYDLQISLNTYSNLPNLDSNSTLYVHPIIKEDSHTFYGFFNIDEKEMFKALITVSGVGANTARMMLSSKTANELKSLILMGDDNALTKIKGIGAKTAQRIVLELKEKIFKIGNDDITVDSTQSSNPSVIWQEAVEALVSLGIARNVAQNGIKNAIAKQPELEQNIEELIKFTLQNI